MKRLFTPLMLCCTWLIVQGRCQAVPVMFSDVYSMQVLHLEPELQPRPGVRLFQFNSFSVPVYSFYPAPRVWQVPITELPTTITYGLRPWTKTMPFNFDNGLILGVRHIRPYDRIIDFRFERAEVELTYWYEGTTIDIYKAQWRIFGDATIVPEPGWFAMAMSILPFVIGMRVRSDDFIHP